MWRRRIPRQARRQRRRHGHIANVVDVARKREAWLKSVTIVIFEQVVTITVGSTIWTEIVCVILVTIVINDQ
jgi:hypothetical protein